MIDRGELNKLLGALNLQMHNDSRAWFGPEASDNTVIYVLGLVGESGEAADVYKKYLRGSLSFESMKEQIAVELIDVFIYWIHLVHMLDVNVEDVYKAKRMFNEQRFGDAR
jgi:NTP pyrophosphatase (non-canonical NTP hydrolase)